MEAVLAGDVASVTRCLSHKRIDPNKPVQSSFFGTCPVLVALVQQKNVDESTRCEIARLLIEAGARPDLPDDFGNSALHRIECTPAVMKILLSAKPPPNVDVKGQMTTHR